LVESPKEKENYGTVNAAPAKMRTTRRRQDGIRAQIFEKGAGAHE
jgi:hypothetical protein